MEKGPIGVIGPFSLILRSYERVGPVPGAGG